MNETEYSPLVQETRELMKRIAEAVGEAECAGFFSRAKIRKKLIALYEELCVRQKMIIMAQKELLAEIETAGKRNDSSEDPLRLKEQYDELTSLADDIGGQLDNISL